MDEASAHPRASPRLCHRNAPTWAANLSLPPGHCAHPRPGHTPRPWSAERVVRPLPTSPVSFHTLRHIRFSSVPQMHHEPLAPRGLCTCKPLWFGFPRPPYALLILPPSSPLVKLQHRFFRGPSLTRGTGSRASLTSLHSTTRFSAGLVACKRACVCDSCLVSLHRTLRQQRGDRGFSVCHSLLAPSSVPSVLWVLNIYRLLCKQRWELSCPPHHGDMIQTANRHPRN